MRKFLISLMVLPMILVFGSLVAGQAQAGSITVEVFDTDGDGCNDYEEQNDDPTLGGQRDPSNFWDFYSVPNGMGARDRVISVGDIAALVQRFGANDNGGMAPINRSSDPLNTQVPGSGYHPIFDRGGPLPNAQYVWNLAPADGAISAADISVLVRQFGHRCEGPFTKTIDLDAECGTLVKDEGEPLDPLELTDGQAHTECFLVKDPNTGNILDVRRVEITADTTQEEEVLLEEEPEPLSAPGVAAKGLASDIGLDQLRLLVDLQIRKSYIPGRLGQG